MLIQSRDNPKIKLYTRLRDKKSARVDEGLFVLEGERLVAEALKEGVGLRSVFYTRLAEERFSGLVSDLCALCGQEAFEISDDAAQKLAGTVSPQGIFAIASRLDKTPPLDKIVFGGKYLILNRLQDPGNVGTILRAADAVGVSGVYLCSSCDIYNPKLVRSTMGSLFRLPVADCLSFEDTVSLFRRSGIPVYASVVDQDAADLSEFKFPESCAVVIGNEGNGLSAGETSLCDGRITIRMRGNTESLNAAAAAAILLWELMK